jgi:hypothetical protein
MRHAAVHDKSLADWRSNIYRCHDAAECPSFVAFGRIQTAFLLDCSAVVQLCASLSCILI